MESKVNFTLVGAFVLVLATALVGVVLWLASGGAYQTHYESYDASVEESVSGLNPKAPVKYNGVDVGRVERIWLDPENPQRVKLRFQIERGTPVKVDTVATLKTQGLTGIAYVELSGGTPGSPALTRRDGQRHPVIQTQPSLSTRLENVLTQVLARLDSTSRTINEVLSPANRQAFSGALADIASVARTIAARRAALDTAITNAGQTLQGTAQASQQIGPVLQRIERSAQAIETMGQSVAATSNGAGKAVDTVAADMQRIGAQTLPELERLMGEMAALTTSLRRLSDQTQRDPRGLLFGRQPVPSGPGEAGPRP
jgi:phospholipid/cholesterol/gamma-HCH transport system substrate-binding protein